LIVLALTAFTGAAAAAATASSAAPSYPPPCPTQPLVWQSNGNYYVSVPNPTGSSCRIVVEVPGSIKRPAASQRNASLVAPNGCPTESPVYESNGHDYARVPDPSGKSCWVIVELPVTVPPTLG
jgi:hypothetical protein